MLAVMSLFAFSCKRKHHVDPIAPDIYIAAYEYTDVNKTAKYWKNGQPTELMSNNNGITATSVSAAGRDVHVVGWDADNNYVASGKYWKNGILQSFSGTYSASVLSKVLVVANNVYIAGTGTNSDGYYAMYWKNGVPVVLKNSYGGWARDMVIVNGDVYVAGNAASAGGALSAAKYWKNGIDVQLSTGSEQHIVTGIAVSNDDVHVVGMMGGFREVAKYWKNGVETILSPLSYHSSAEDIAISGSDVYIVGRINDSMGYSMAQIWKNGIATILPEGTSATGIAVVGNDIYVSGTGLNGVTSVAKYWKNGVPVNLSNGEHNVFATSIFVTAP